MRKRVAGACTLVIGSGPNAEIARSGQGETRLLRERSQENQ
jgi:hypothetical protein